MIFLFKHLNDLRPKTHDDKHIVRFDTDHVSVVLRIAADGSLEIRSVNHKKLRFNIRDHETMNVSTS